MSLFLFEYESDPEPYEDWSVPIFVFLGTAEQADQELIRLNAKNDGVWYRSKLKADEICSADNPYQGDPDE